MHVVVAYDGGIEHHPFPTLVIAMIDQADRFLSGQGRGNHRPVGWIGRQGIIVSAKHGEQGAEIVLVPRQGDDVPDKGVFGNRLVGPLKDQVIDLGIGKSGLDGQRKRRCDQDVTDISEADNKK
jgi:hypothetical protein